MRVTYGVQKDIMASYRRVFRRLTLAVSCGQNASVLAVSSTGLLCRRL